MSQTNTNALNISVNPTALFEGGFTLENFKKAVHILYYGQNTDLKKKADEFLCDFDRQNEAWDISINILNTPELDEEAYYNASQIIKKKIRFDFGNFTENKEVIQNLATFLLEKIVQFKDHKFYLLTNFCKCFALLTVFAHPMFPDIIKLVCERLNDKDIKNLMSLLLIFTYLAEIVNDNEIVVDENYRLSYEVFLQGISDEVIVFIDYLIKVIGNEEYKNQLIKADPNMNNFFRLMNKHIVECFRNWLDVGLSGVIFSKLQTDFIGVINFIFNIDVENMETYSECICLLLKLPLQNQQMGSLGPIILSKVISFKERVFQAIKIRDEEEIKFFLDIFIHLCENNISEIITEYRIDLLQLILELTKHSPSDRIGFACDFWQKFNFYLIDKQVPSNEIMEKFGEIIKEVIVGLLKLIKFEDSVFLELNQSKSKNLKDPHFYKETITYRKTVKLFLLDMAGFYGFNYLYNNIILPVITSIINEIKKEMNNITAWAVLEAAIFSFGSICRTIEKDQDLSFLDTLFDTIFEIPENLIQIKKTVTDVIDEIGSILSLRPNILMKAFNYLLVGTENPLIIKYCSVTLKNLLSDNKKILSKNKEDLINIYNERVKMKALENDTYRKILEGVVEVVCEGDNEEEIKNNIVQILSTWVILLTQAKNKLEESGELNVEELDSLKNILEIIKVIIRAVHESLNSKYFAIMNLIFSELWQTLRIILQKYNYNSEIVEVITQINKHFMRGMGSEFKKYLEDYMNIILEGYKINPISSYIYAFEVIASVFVNDTSVADLLKLMLKELCLQTFNFYLVTPEDFDNNPHLTEDFFGLFYRLIRLNPFIILDFELFENIFMVCINNIGLTHPDSAKNIIYFLDKIITFHENPKIRSLDEKIIGMYYEKVKSNVKKVGEYFVNKMISYILSVPPSLIFENLKDLVKDFVQNYPEDSAIWFQTSLKNLPQDCLTNKEKEKMVNTILNYNDDTMDDILENFYRRSLSRLYRGT